MLDRISGRSAGGGRDGRSRRERPAPRGMRVLGIKGNEALFGRLCRADFNFLAGQRFAAPGDILEILLPQSVVGRAQNGHGFFVNEFGDPLIFRDATFERILTELERERPVLRADRVRERRNALVDAVARHVMAHLESETMPLDARDGPLLGVEFLAGRRVETRAFLRGLVLAGNMDDADQRNMTLSWHRRDLCGETYELGGGEIRVVDAERFRRAGIVDPGRFAWEDDELQQLEKLGVLVRADDAGEWTYPKYDQAFFRRRMGEGVCDDLAMIRIGAAEGFDAMLGAFVMDAIDTYDKYLIRFRNGGSDGVLAGRVQDTWRERYGEPLVGGEDILDLIWFAAKDNAPRLPLSSSHRRLIQFEGRCAAPTLLHHWRFLQGEPLDDIKLGFVRMPAAEFYAAAHQRLQETGFETPEPDFKPRG